MESSEVPVLLYEEDNHEENQWEQIQTNIKASEDLFFNTVFAGFTHNRNETQIDEIYKKYYDPANNKILESIIQEKAGDMNPVEMTLFKHEIQGRRIQSIKNNDNLPWKELETPISENEMKFYLHSYLRCIQANDKNMEKAGIEAETVAGFAQLLLESEILANKKEQNEIFEMLSSGMKLTEEEFEQLF